ncbi:hypothetical protein [Clostridium massiliodielmoense]|uniref:hypothetical protein n=1 Tax=Clostridium massiliodielmoense TaxID=1776385 RepID=UPI0001665E05|nr:hypothetical protein [Clostridium massiliodielmoense]EDS76150.1 conserved hypothetical protein [Clostridium botulinum C str. Eklund]EDS77690.1 conserved hypothetical protein [Clostridium botulinum C str. Eklund]KEH93297.1 hypothetical protein Z962_10505 [Clostridium botulinum C/D str. BKT12695]NEZ50354.1 hypothetical protein [Clostridium botulinum]
MDWKKRIKDIVNNNKWVKNDTGLWKVQCAKLFEDNNTLRLILVTDELEGPVSAHVEKIIITNNKDLILFYDERFNSILKEEDYDKFSKIVNREQWDALFTGEATKNLVAMNVVGSEEGFYVEPHEAINQFVDNYDEKLSEELDKQFNL